LQQNKTDITPGDSGGTMKRFKKFSLFAIPGLLLLLGGCGGSGGSSELSGTLALSVSAPAATGVPGSATATYAASDGRNPQGVKINFSTDRPDIVHLSATDASVGSDGTAMVPFTTIAVPADATAVIYAKTGGLSQFQTISIAGTPDAPPPQPPVPPTATSITFVTASPTSIALKGMGGAGSSETSDVSFQVRDANNNGVPNVVVDFSLNTSIGGITIAPAFGTTDSGGRVQTKVSSGIIATPVKVTATVRSTTLSAQSSQLVIFSGLPDEDSLSVSLSVFNPEAWNYDGEQVAVTARIADHFNNPVANTAIYFTTEGGSIDGFCVTDATGACSVTWRSQNPRPMQDPVTNNGRVTLLVYAVGEESFVDYNGNGIADAGEYVDTSEAYRDDDENGKRGDGSVVNGPLETFIDFNQNRDFNGPDGFFNGVLRPASTEPITKHIFKNVTLVMSSSAAIITASTDINGVPTPITNINGATSFDIIVTDTNGNTMPAGTTVSITTDNGKLTGATSFTVPSNNADYGVDLPVAISSDGTVNAGGAVTIKVKSPKGLETIAIIPIVGGV
jgi:hypothetical protein